MRECSPPKTCHVSRVTCHMSFFFLRTQWWSLSVEGLWSTGPTPSSCFLSHIYAFYTLPFLQIKKFTIPYHTIQYKYGSWLSEQWCDRQQVTYRLLKILISLNLTKCWGDNYILSETGILLMFRLSTYLQRIERRKRTNNVLQNWISNSGILVTSINICYWGVFN